jgi:hypothetical protein
MTICNILKQSNPWLRNLFLDCGITNALDGSENEFVHCAKELPDLQLPFIDESNHDPFLYSDPERSDD